MERLLYYSLWGNKSDLSFNPPRFSQSQVEQSQREIFNKEL